MAFWAGGDGGRERESSIRRDFLGPAARELETNFDEFSACSDAEAVFGGVVRVSVVEAPQGILLIVHMANNRPRHHADGYADDQSTSYQLFHLTLAPNVSSAKQQVPLDCS